MTTKLGQYLYHVRGSYKRYLWSALELKPEIITTKCQKVPKMTFAYLYAASRGCPKLGYNGFQRPSTMC